MTDVTALLDRLRAGDPRAAGELFDRVYAELKRMAAAQVQAEASHSHSPTELVHEAYLRLFPCPAPAFADRAYFFAAAATAMRRVRVDHARARAVVRRALADADETVRQAAIHSASVWRDRAAVPLLLELSESLLQPLPRSSQKKKVATTSFTGSSSHESSSK